MFKLLESPRSLQELCINIISDNVGAFCDVLPYENGESTSLGSSSMTPDERPSCSYVDLPPKSAPLTPNNSSGVNAPGTRLRFKCFMKVLTFRNSEQLLASLSEKKALTDLTITLFDSKTTSLKHVRLKDASSVSVEGLAILKQHRVIELEVNGLKITVKELIECLGDWSLENLRSLTVANGSFIDRSSDGHFRSLSRLKSLHTLNVSGTNFDDEDLETLPLLQLENLDISCTCVRDLTPLKTCKDRLKSLAMYNLQLVNNAGFTSILVELTKLQMLDVSEDKDAYIYSPLKIKVRNLLKATHCLPELTSLDLSGKGNVIWEDMTKFLKAHKQLRFLGLVDTNACYMDSLLKPSHDDFRPDLKVSGLASKAQILEALSRYPSRRAVVEKCFKRLLPLTQDTKEACPDIIELVISSMRPHSANWIITMTGTCCLHNLTKRELASKIHPCILKRAVDITLTTMERYRYLQRMQLNAQLTLLNDTIIQKMTFDKYRFVKILMNSLLAIDDPSINGISINMLSILLRQVSNEEKSKLASKENMSKLLSNLRSQYTLIVQNTLDALVSLTDDCEAVCKVFIEEVDVEQFYELLISFRGNFNAEMSIVVLLSNIAEVHEIRHRILQPVLVTSVSKLLDSESFEVSFVAAGLAAHFLIDGPRAWSIDSSMTSRSKLLDKLAKTITNWRPPDAEFISFCSFRPHLRLLRCTNDYQVQLWAAWAIYHVCIRNPKRYCHLLAAEGGAEILKSLENVESEGGTEPSVREFCHSILEVLALHLC